MSPQPPIPSRSIEGEIVVATPHLGLVEAELADLGVTPLERETSNELGLTLLRLSAAEVRRAAGAPPTGGRLAAADPLTRMLDDLYGRFERRLGGWTPSIGKNRVVAGLHNITGGGEGSPRQVSGALAPREAEPGSGVRVGVADTALYPHPWYEGACFSPPASRLDTDRPDGYEQGHATFVSGLVLQAAPGSVVEVRRVLDDDGTADSWSVATKLVLLARAGLDVLNLSLGCFTDDNRAPLVLSTALDRMPAHVVVVAAAGNHGDSELAPLPFWPAALEEVVAVAAVDAHGGRPAWSPDAAELPWIDVVATGVAVTSTYLPRIERAGRPAEDFGAVASWSGTSFAAAKVSGVLAARTVPGVISAGYVLRDLLRNPPKSWKNVPWLA
jgi:membrane-anchored mycosin MYCP